MTIRRAFPLSAACVLAVLAYGAPARAQTDAMRLAHITAANQVGIMEYCRDKGWADQVAVDGQKKAAANLPAASDQAGLSDAEATGRKGELMNGGTTVALSAMAQRSNTTEKDLCTRMASAARTAATQSSTMPSFPGMPSGMTMPAAPSGMAMPTAPSSMTIPGMPGLPKPQ